MLGILFLSEGMRMKAYEYTPNPNTKG